MSYVKKNQMSVFLIKNGIIEHADILENYNSLHLKEIRSEDNEITGTLYFSGSYEYPPDWLKDFFGSIDLGVPFKNSNTRAVYLVEASNRLFAVVFGYGKSMLKKSVFEEDFGLYTTLNLVKPDTLRSIHKTDLSLSGKKSLEQLTISGDITNFGIDVERDLVNEVTGKSKVEELGNIISGRESFHTKVAAKHGNVKEFLEEFLTYFQKSDYQNDFGWIDNVKGVKNELLIEKLNQKLVAKIKSNNHERVWLAVPEVIIWSKVEGFKYGKSAPKHNGLYDDLYLEDFKNLFSDEINEIEPDDLSKKFHIFCGYDFTGKIFDKWNLFDCLYCEIDYEGKSYVLSNGRWYKVKTDFISNIKDRFQLIPSLDINLPEFDENKYAGKGEDKGEKGYNKDVEASNNDYILFDGKNINIGGGRSKVEFCDLYSKSTKRLIHIKKYGGSSVFSHLFNQGLVSGELLLSEKKFRQEVNSLLTDDCKFTDINLQPNANEYHIVFAVISSSESDLDLPFFSKVSLSNVHRRLQTMGFNVYKAKIQKVER